MFTFRFPEILTIVVRGIKDVDFSHLSKKFSVQNNCGQPYNNFQNLELESSDDLSRGCTNEKTRKTYDPNKLPVGFAPTHFMHAWIPFLLNISNHLCCWIMFNKTNKFSSLFSSVTDAISNDLFFGNKIYSQSKLRREEDINSTRVGSSFLFSLFFSTWFTLSRDEFQDLVITMDCYSANLWNWPLHFPATNATYLIVCAHVKSHLRLYLSV